MLNISLNMNIPQSVNSSSTLHITEILFVTATEMNLKNVKGNVRHQ